MKKPITSWGNVAGWYDELLEQSADSYQEKVILPNLLRIIDAGIPAGGKGTTILDLACGQGYFTRAFYDNFNAKGVKVIGCDISTELIERARNHSPKKIEYTVAPADDFSKVNIPKLNLVTIILALQNIDNLSGVFAECATVLKPGGRLIFVLTHPAFRIPKRSSWQWDDAENKQYRRIDGYMSDSSVSIDMTPGKAAADQKTFTASFHRPLQSYVKALAKAGFAVIRLEEWISHKVSQKGPRAEEEDRMRKEIPMFLCVEAVRG